MLLSIDTNAKTIKGQQYGFLTGILYLAPYDISGNNTCSMAKTAKCYKACLYSSGRGAFNSVQNARIRKTKEFYANPQLFMETLAKDIKTLIRKAAKLGLTPLVRLNGTSDIRWENVRFDYGFGNEQVTIFDLFPDVQFYDYTKIANRKDIPENYDLTFSYSGVEAYAPYVQKAIESGMRLAVVFRHEKDIPDSFMGLPVVSGDKSDIRHLDPKKAIVALYAKGKAKKDYTGFVIDIKSV